MRVDSLWKSTLGSRLLMRKKSMTRSWDASPFSEKRGNDVQRSVVYLISYFAAGDSFRSSTP